MQKDKSCKTALVLAGGLGTRLREVVSDVPKPMAPVNGKPFLHHLLDFYFLKGIKVFYISIGYKKEVISSYFASNSGNYEVKFIEEDSQLGTGGAIKKAINCIENEGELLVLNGDTLCDIDISYMDSMLSNSDADIVIAAKKQSSQERYDGFSIDGQGFASQSSATNGNFISLGAYLVSISGMKKKLESKPVQFSFEKDFLYNDCDNVKIGVAPSLSPFLDIGVPSDYLRAGSFIESLFSSTSPRADITRSVFQSNAESLITLINEVQNNHDFQDTLVHATSDLYKTITNGGTIYIAGNGGSAADAAHFSGEFLCRLTFDRPPINSEALSTDLSTITAIANDYSFEHIFLRQLQAKMTSDDIFIAFTTSGNSANIVKALEYCMKYDYKSILFTGCTGGESSKYSNHTFLVPSTNTARIQEVHKLLLHSLCESLEYLRYSDTK